jgi:hypothetical protein
MNQALYAHMNNKRKMKKKIHNENLNSTYMLHSSVDAKQLSVHPALPSVVSKLLM